MEDKYAINLLSSSGKILSGSFTLLDESPQNFDQVQLRLQFENINVVKVEDDYFTALCEIRKDLERVGLKPICYGASKNVFPSGMSRGMGYGILAYKLQMGRKALQSDLVNIFDVGDDIEVATVAEQKQFYERWKTD